MFKHEVPWNIHACLVIEWKKSIYFFRIRYGVISTYNVSIASVTKLHTIYACLQGAKVFRVCEVQSIPLVILGAWLRRAAYEDLGLDLPPLVGFATFILWLLHFAAASWRIIKMCAVKPRFLAAIVGLISPGSSRSWQVRKTRKVPQPTENTNFQWEARWCSFAKW